MHESGAQTPRPEEQVAQVERYYHSTIEHLDDTQLSMFGAETTYFDGEQTHQVETNGNSVRELICNACLLRTGVRLEDYRIPEELSAPEITALVRGNATEYHGLVMGDGDDTFDILYASLVRDTRARATAAEYLGAPDSDFLRFVREQQKQGRPTPLELSVEEIEARAAHIDALRAQILPEGQQRFVVLPTSPEARAWWTDEYEAEAQQALGLSAGELDAALAWQIVQPKYADTEMSVFAIRPNGQEEHWTAFTTPSIESADQFGWHGNYGARPAVLRDDNVGLAFGTNRANYHDVYERRMLPEGHGSILHQYALLGTMKAEALITSGTTQPVGLAA